MNVVDQNTTKAVRSTLRSASRLTVLGTAAMLLTAAPALAQRDLKDIPPPEPELERQALELADGLEINLFAADPLLAKPVQMNFDAAGRLWVATSETYPHILPGQAANDKIIVLEDADQDGRADKTTVFADGLLIPTGVEPGSFAGTNGAFVANSTELIYLGDEDGDLKSDYRTTLLSGFGTEDTHHLLHTLRWGPDGRLYMNQSIYIHSHIETPYGVRRLGGGGIWQYHPQTQRLEVLSRGWINPWGHQHDKWGQSFVTDGAGGEGINYTFPGATFPTAPGAARVLSGLNPGSPKYCGLEIISGRHFPDDWQGDLITCDFRAHRVVRFKLTESGSGYVSREQPEVIKTTHVAFRPIDVRLGPDGALYIADWYNPIIQHGEVDFRDPRRDHTHGRIWRVTAKGRPSAPRPSFDAETPTKTFDQLRAPEAYARHFAKRSLVDQWAPEDLDAWIVKLDKNAPDYDQARLEALWLQQTWDDVDLVLVETLLESKDHHVRAAAVRAAGSLVENEASLYERIAARAQDEHPQVRLEAVCALRNVATPESVAAALQVLDRPMDEFIDFALWQTCREQKDVWLPTVLAEKSESPLYDKPLQLEFALRAVDEPAIVPPLVRLLNGGRLPVDRREGVLELVARLGAPQDLAMIFRRVLESPNQDADAQLALINALAGAATTRNVRPAGDLSLLDEILEAPDERVAAAAARLLGIWKIEQARPDLIRMAETKKDPAARNLAAVAALGDLGGSASLQALIKLSSDSFSTPTRQTAVMALAKGYPSAAGQAAVSLLTSVEPDTVDAAAIIEAFTTRQNAAAAFRAALADKRLPADVAKLAVRTARSSAKPDEALITALLKAGGISGTGLQLTPEQTAQLVDDVKKSGDPARGETLFHRKDLNCVKCHAVGGAGGRVGPDLVSIGASAQLDYLVDSLVQPNKAIKEGYHSLVVVTDDGLTLSGVKVRETDKDLILRNAEDVELTVPLKAIEERTQGMSLMPAGLVDNLTRQELIDLVRFLGELGKVGPYQLKPDRTVRRWESFVMTQQGVELLRRNRLGIAATNDARLSWEPAYARFDGALRLDMLGVLGSVKNKFMKVPPFTLVRFQIDVQQAGPIDLQFDTAASLQIWLDGKPLEPADRLRIEPSVGRHTVTIAVDREARNDRLACKLVDVPGSPAQAIPVTVK